LARFYQLPIQLANSLGSKLDPAGSAEQKGGSMGAADLNPDGLVTAGECRATVIQGGNY
jgi:hypothetical protein